MINFTIEDISYGLDNLFPTDKFDELCERLEDRFDFDVYVHLVNGVPSASVDTLEALELITPVFIAVVSE